MLQRTRELKEMKQKQEDAKHIGFYAGIHQTGLSATLKSGYLTLVSRQHNLGQLGGQ
jgi:hypothetical protein